MKKLFLFLFLLAGIVTQASDLEKLHRSFMETLPRNIDSAYTIATRLLQEAEKERSIEWQVRALDDQAEALLYMGHVEQAVSKLEQAVRLASKTGKNELTCRVWFNLGNACSQSSRYNRALESFKEAARIAEQLGDKKKWSIALANTGGVYQMMEDIKQSEIYYYKAYRLAEALNDPFKTQIEYQLASLQMKSGQHDKALQWVEKALKSAETMNDQVLLCRGYLLKGEIYREKKEFASAAKHYQLALEISEKIGDVVTTGEIYLQQARLSLQQKKYAAAQGQAEKALNLARETGNMRAMRDGYELCAEIATAQGKTSRAEEYRKHSQVIDDSLKQEEMTRLQMKVEMEKAEKELELKRKEIELKAKEQEQKLKELEAKQKAQQRQPFYIFIGAIVLVLAIVFFLLYKNRTRKVH